MLTQVNGNIAAALFTQNFKFGCLYNELIINGKEYQFSFERSNNYYYVSRTKPPRFQGKKYKTKMDSASVIQRQFNHNLAAFVAIQPPPIIVTTAEQAKEPDSRHYIHAEHFARAKGNYSFRMPKHQHRVMEVKRQRNDSQTESVVSEAPITSSGSFSVPPSPTTPPEPPIYDQPRLPPKLKDEEKYIFMKSQLSLATQPYENVKPT